MTPPQNQESNASRAKNTLEFMQASRRARNAGNPLTTMIGREDATRQATFAQDLLRNAAHIAAEQERVEVALQPILRDAAALKVNEANQRLLEASQRQLEALRAKEETLEENLSKMALELKKCEEEVARLRLGLAQLQQSYQAAPSQAAADIQKAGTICAQLTAQVTRQGYQ